MYTFEIRVEDIDLETIKACTCLRTFERFIEVLSADGYLPDLLEVCFSMIVLSTFSQEARKQLWRLDPATSPVRKCSNPVPAESGSSSMKVL